MRNRSGPKATEVVMEQTRLFLSLVNGYARSLVTDPPVGHNRGW